MDAELKALQDQGLISQDPAPVKEPVKENIITDPPVPQAVPESSKEPLEQPTFDYKKVLGEWADPDKAITIPERLSKIQEYETKLQELESRKVPSFANESIAKFNSFVSKTNISNFDVFTKVSKMDLDSAEPKEILAAKMLLDSPELANKYSFSEIVRFTERKFNLDPDEVDEDTLEFSKMEASVLSDKAKKEITELREGLTVEQNQPQLDTKVLAENWKPVVDAMANKFDKYSVKLNEQGASFDFAIPEEDRPVIAQGVHQILVNNAMPYTEDSVSQAEKAMKAKYLIDNQAKIFSAFKAKIESDIEKGVIDEYRRPSQDNPSDVNTDAPAKIDIAEQIYQAEMGNM